MFPTNGECMRKDEVERNWRPLRRPRLREYCGARMAKLTLPEFFEILLGSALCCEFLVASDRIWQLGPYLDGNGIDLPDGSACIGGEQWVDPKEAKA